MIQLKAFQCLNYNVLINPRICAAVGRRLASNSRKVNQDLKIKQGRTSFWFLASSAAFGYAMVSYVVYHYTKIKNMPAPPEGVELPNVQKNLVKLDGSTAKENPFSRIAETYDDEINFAEFTLSMKKWRKQLLQKASGDVLEMGAGTGRNLDCYNMTNLKSLNQCDKNDRMLHKALLKYNEKRRMFELRQIDVYFSLQDGASTNFKDDAFDTVVETFGLCSFADPVQVLKEMARVTKPGGKILLLEHGRSKYTWMNNILDKTAVDHASKWGCWWNRDIVALVKEAGLDIDSVKTRHFGTTYQIEATVNK